MLANIENDCGNKVATEAVCANTAWNLYSDPNEHGPFCCQEGEIPIADPNAPFGECWVAGSPVISSEIASSVSHSPYLYPYKAPGLDNQVICLDTSGPDHILALDLRNGQRHRLPHSISTNHGFGGSH
jgi:hypothetical protein